MYYRGYYIETDGKRFRAYKRKLTLIFRQREYMEGASIAVFDSLSEAKAAIDRVLGKKLKKKWRLVEPLDGCSEV